MSESVSIGDLPAFAREAGVRHGHILVDEGRLYMGVVPPYSEVGVTRTYRWVKDRQSIFVVTEWESR